MDVKTNFYKARQQIVFFYKTATWFYKKLLIISFNYLYLFFDFLKRENVFHMFKVLKYKMGVD